jgi:hypothetical protein
MSMIFKIVTNNFKLLIAAAVLLNIIGCSTISTNKRAANLSALTANKTYQLRVRSGNLALDKIIYDYTSTRLGEYLRIACRQNCDNYIEIVFTSTLKDGVSGSSAGYATNMIYGSSWYTGDDAPWLNRYYPGSEMEIAGGGIFSRQNSTIIATIRDMQDGILWKTHFTYKGGTDLSGLYVKTADEAARVSLDTVIERFEKDFILTPEVKGPEARDKMPAVALIIDGNGAVAGEDTAVKDAFVEKTVSQEIITEKE